MITDLWTVMRKEWKEFFLQYGSTSKALLNVAILVGLLGVYLPLTSGRAWVTSWIPLYWTWMPLLLVLTFSTDSIAGERERHTLETLLASRLPDGAILLGKLAAAVSYSCGLMLAGLLVGLITANIAFGQGTLLLYSGQLVASVLILSLLGSTFIAGLGVLVSVRASTVRQAYQTIAIPLTVVAVLPSLAILVLPEAWKTWLFTLMFKTDASATIATVAITLLLLADAGLIALAMARFQRAKLILD